MSADNGDRTPKLLRYTLWLDRARWPRTWEILALSVLRVEVAQNELARLTGAEPVGPWTWGWVPPGGDIPEPYAADLRFERRPVGSALLYGSCPAVPRTPKGATPRLWTPGDN